MRPLPLVMEAMMKLVPEDFANRKELISEFEKIQQSILYTAPEALSIRWEETAEVLGYCIGTPTEEWQIKLAQVFNGQIDYLKILKD